MNTFRRSISIFLAVALMLIHFQDIESAASSRRRPGGSGGVGHVGGNGGGNNGGNGGGHNGGDGGSNASGNKGEPIENPADSDEYAEESEEYSEEETEARIFFSSLTQAEQLSLMQMSIRYHNVGQKSEKPSKDQDILEILEPIPTGLADKMLNGKIPRYWQRNFTKWLVTDFNLKPSHLNLFLSTGRFCKEKEICPSFESIGGLCCPFG